MIKFSVNVSLMSRLIRKISTITFACLLLLNGVAGAAVVIGNCSSSMDRDPMDMHHCNGLLNFTLPAMGCCGECNDIFCNLMKNPLQDANAINSLPLLGSFYPFCLATVDPIAEPGSWIAFLETGYLLSATPAWRQIPLYIEHLSLII